MAVTVVRLPRSFAGDKAASLEDFFNSMAHALSRGDPARKEAIQHFCNRVQVSLSARAVFDVGGAIHQHRWNNWNQSADRDGDDDENRKRR